MIMPDYRYNPIENNFTTYQAVETPKVELNLPLMSSPLDISDWSTGISENGTPIVKSNLPRMTDSETIAEFNPSTEESYSVSTNNTGNTRKAMDFFMSKGLAAHQAAGIVGNLMVESGDNTLSKTSNLGDHGKSYGIGQWNGSRRKNLENFAKNRGKDMSDFQTQLEFIWHEITDGDQVSFKVLEGLKNSKNVTEATQSFMSRYERPGIPHLDKRIKHAKSLLA